MLTVDLVDGFLRSVRGQALREGHRYAREQRVQPFTGSMEAVATVVGGRSDDFEVRLWVEDGCLAHRCECPSWRLPCKHEVAAALELRAWLDQGPALADTIDPDAGRLAALEERRRSARAEKLTVRAADPPYLEVGSASGFVYRVRLRGGVDGPHSCECPDFEANRLHTCKHVERVRGWLANSRARRPAALTRRAAQAHVYLHFGEVLEPRLFGSAAGPGVTAMRKRFDAEGLPRNPVHGGEAALLNWLGPVRDHLDERDREWLAQRASRRPSLASGPFKTHLPALPLEPYPYQWQGAEFLARNGRALLADEMGLGKTVQAILAAGAMRRALKPVRSVTVVCPASLRGGWQDEIRRWLGDEVTLLEGNAHQRCKVIATKPTWLVTHYEQVLRDFSSHSAHPPDLLIIDEAQRAKGLQARTARVLKAIPSRHLFALTGTPLENRLEDAYAIAQLVDQRLLPPLWQIDRDHFVREDGGKRVVLYRNLGALRSRLEPAFLRRRKEDVQLQLPEQLRSASFVPMHEAVKDTYDEVMGQVARIASKKVILPRDLERMQRLLVIARRCCNGPHMLGIDADDRKVPKMAELDQILRDLCLGEGRKIVVFSEWTDMTNRVEALCARLGLHAYHLKGDVPVRARPVLIRDFTERKGPAVFISTDAGGVGLNLQAADAVVNLDLPWNPARLEQRIARVHRIGSRSTVQVSLLVCRDSVEERILHLHEVKKNVLANIWAEGGEDAITAPGGSGAFRQMVEDLLKGRKEGTGETTGAVGTEAQAQAVRAAVSPAPAADREDGDDRTEREQPPSREASSSLVDPSVVAAAVAAVAPALPPDHRRSLATVFRALAEALEA